MPQQQQKFLSIQSLVKLSEVNEIELLLILLAHPATKH